MSRGLGRELGGYGQVVLVFWCLRSEMVGWWRGEGKILGVCCCFCWVLEVLEDERSLLRA